MTEFRELMLRGGVSLAWLGRTVGRSRGALVRWDDGSARVPVAVMDWLRERAANLPPRLPPVR